MNLPVFCTDIFPKFLIISSNVPTLVYYAHISVMIVALILGFFIISKGRKELTNNVLFFTLMSFFAWMLCDLIFWASNSSDMIMFSWAMDILVEPLIYIGCFYLLYLIAYKKDLPFSGKLILGLLFLPVIILTPTSYNLAGFDVTSCLSIEGFLGFYDYIIEGLLVAGILIMFLKKYRASEDSLLKKQILYITIGIFLFLFAFSWGNLASSLTDNWQISLVGMLFMPFFAGFLVYSIIRFKTFNIKLIGAQALVITLGILIAVQFIFIKTPISYILNSVALCLIVIFGSFLVRSVKREVQQREQLEILSEQLFDANEKLKGLDKLKTEFLSLASHQLRSPLTAIKGYASMMLDGDFGEFPKESHEAVDRIFQSSQNLGKIVEDLLNVSKIEQGGMKYEMAPFNLAEVAEGMTKDLSIVADKKGLIMSFDTDGSNAYIVNGDKEKIRQVILNLIDNSIKYTKEGGSVIVSMKKSNNKILFSVKDTGMGMTPEIKATLFQKFNRGEGARMNTSGSGLGLYLARQIVEAHKGRIWVDSEGPNKGSTFNMELDAVMN